MTSTNLTSQQQKEVKAEVKAEVEKKVEKIDQKVEQKVEKEVSKRIKLLEKSAKTLSFFGSEFKKQTSIAIMAAFGFLIALVWRDLISNVINTIVKPHLITAYPYLSDLISAIIITVIAVIGIALISRWAKSPDKPQ